MIGECFKHPKARAVTVLIVLKNEPFYEFIAKLILKIKLCLRSKYKQQIYQELLVSAYLFHINTLIKRRIFLFSL